MEPDTEETGVITVAYSGYCELSASINGTKEVLSVNRKQFYAFGIRCDGDMTNILEEGIEINFCFSVHQSRMVVTMAWLGDKPEIVDDESESDIEGTGVITKIAKHRGEMFAYVNNKHEFVSFHRRIFYAFGMRCEGNLTNILEEGMKVEFSYSVSESRITVIFVWLGDKPDRLLVDSLPEALYNETGRICQMKDDENFIVQSESTSDSVLVGRKDVYLYGRPNTLDLAIGDYIHFDAIPLDFEDSSGARYEATCAWIGEVPRIVDRFGLNIRDNTIQPEYDLKYFEKNCVDGTVAVIPSKVIAFVDVEYRGCIEQVLLFRSSFEKSCECLQDFVSVGDRILLCLGVKSIFEGCSRLYVVKAWRNVFEKNLSNLTKIEPKSELPMTPAVVSRNNSVEVVVTTGGQFTKQSAVLFRDPPLSGIISRCSVTKSNKQKIKPNSMGLITSKDCSSLTMLVRMCDFYIDGLPCTVPKSFASVVDSNCPVNFEGVKNPPERAENTKSSHKATCAWIGPKPCVSTVALRIGRILANISCLKKRRVQGLVVRFYFPDKAIVVAFVGKLCVPNQHRIVCLHRSSFPHSTKKSKSASNLISDFVQLGQRISFDLVNDPECKIPVRAINVK